MKAKLLALLILLPISVLAAQGYKIVHPDGSVEFTDQPVKNAEEFKLQGAQGYQSSGKGAAPAQGKAATGGKQNGAGDYSQFSIASPAAEETISNTGGSVSISVRVSPALQKDHQVVITVDGKEMARGPSTSFTLSEVDRGAHLVSAAITDSSGTVVRQADPVTFYVFQQSILNPNRKR